MKTNAAVDANGRHLFTPLESRAVRHILYCMHTDTAAPSSKIWFPYNRRLHAEIYYFSFFFFHSLGKKVKLFEWRHDIRENKFHSTEQK